MIGILASITFGVFRGVGGAQARAQAKAELSVIAQALESYKGRYGDYPRTTSQDADLNGKILFESLIGWTRIERNSDGNVAMVELKQGNVPDTGPRTFIDPTKIAFEGSDLPEEPNDEPNRDNYFVDPWGEPYVYVYGKDASSTWRAFGYQLLSSGPDGEYSTSLIGADGLISETEQSSSSNVDNIFVGE